jgi:FtsH-binding integral membrane protein
MLTRNQNAPGALQFFVTSLSISFALVAPFIAMEWLNRRAFQEEFPFVLFTFMWLHALLIALSLTPALRRLQSEKSLRALTLSHWAGLGLSAILIFSYANVVIDQLPCFLGVLICD